LHELYVVLLIGGIAVLAIEDVRDLSGDGLRESFGYTGIYIVLRRGVTNPSVGNIGGVGAKWEQKPRQGLAT